MNNVLKPGIILACALNMAACVHYHPSFSPDRPIYGPLVVSATSLAGQPLPDHEVHEDQPLDLSTLELLAVSHNPHLVEMRAQLHVQELELVVAGMLPEPVYGGGRDRPISGPDHFTAWNNNLNFDIASLITHHDQQRFHHFQSESIHLDLLWQEWLIVGQIRSVCYQLSFDTAALNLLQQELALISNLKTREENAVSKELMTKPLLLETLQQFQTIETDLHNVRQQRDHDLFALHTLLGINPETRLRLAPLPPVHNEMVQPSLMNQRPDLLALKRAAQASDMQLRTAIIQQFPDLSLGLNDGLDTADNHTLGFSIQLPLSFLGQGQARARLAEVSRAEAETVYRLRLAKEDRRLRWLAEQVVFEKTRVKQADTAWRIICAPSAHWQNLLDQGAITLEMVGPQNRSCLERHLDLIREQHKLDELQLDIMTLSGYVPEWERIQHV